MISQAHCYDRVPEAQQTTKAHRKAPNLSDRAIVKHYKSVGRIRKIPVAAGA
jgi:hypothetical protein